MQDGLGFLLPLSYAYRIRPKGSNQFERKRLSTELHSQDFPEFFQNFLIFPNISQTKETISETANYEKKQWKTK